MPQTITAVHAPIGGAAAPRPEVARAVEEAARAALAGGPASDAWVRAHHGMLSLALLHNAGERDAGVHRAAWDAVDGGLEAARRFGAPGLGDGLPVDAFPGSLAGTGISVAELVLTERPVGPVVALLASGVGLGALNLPLARSFADPFTTPRLVESPSLRRGFHFEVHDLEEPRKRMFAAPAELHDLLAVAAESRRFLIRSVVSPEGITAAVASSARRAEVLGSGDDDAPLALVRTGGDAPAVEELLAAFRTPPLVWSGGRVVPLLPAALDDPGVPRAAGLVALAFHVAGERLFAPADLFEGAVFEDARRRARDVAGLLRAPGVFAPRAAEPEERAAGLGGDAGRWSER